MKNLLSIVVLFLLFHEGEMGRFNLLPSAVDTECGKLIDDRNILTVFFLVTMANHNCRHDLKVHTAKM